MACSLLLAGLFLLLGSNAMAQSGKAFLKQGDDFRKQNNLEEALEKYGFAIAVDPELIKAYQARAEVYQLLGRQAERADDLARIADLDPSEADHASAAAMAYLELDNHSTALALTDKALLVSPKHMQALQTRVRVCLALGDLDCAVDASDRAFSVKATTDTYYLRGLVRMATRDYRNAEQDLDKVLSWNHLYEAAYVALAEVQLKLYEQYTGTTMQVRALEKAIEKCTRALELDPSSTDALFTRSKAYALWLEYPKAIDDISRCVALGQTDRDVYFQRASYYHGFGQHQNAVNDLNRVLLDRPLDLAALLLRAQAREANLDMEGALNDLDKASMVMEGDDRISKAERQGVEDSRVRIAMRVFEMNREGDPPRITILEPYNTDEVAHISAALDHVKISGYLRDKSLLKSVTVNGLPADFREDEKDPQFVVSIPLGRDEHEVVVQAIDVYGNLGSTSLVVERTEGVPPAIMVTLPKPTADREITILAGEDELFVEGAVTDESLIRMITVNGLNASYVPDQLDPDFGVKLDLSGKDRFVVRAEDQFGNASEVMYRVTRKAPPPPPTPTLAAKQSTSPKPPASTAAGVTWLVHIENRNYRDFPAMQGNDASRMQEAFANYRVQRTISKKNLSKEQMERFFNVELRSLVRANKVNTILIWYSGHGKTVGGKAYWVPVDGSQDDIYSYFNHGALKSQMQNYSESVRNTVVVSDAASSDASFFELTR